MKQVWILWGKKRHTIENPWIEAVFDDKVLAELHLRVLSADTNYHHWIQEKEITK